MSDDLSKPPPATLPPALSVCVDSLVAGTAMQSRTPGLILGVALDGRMIHTAASGSGLGVATQSRIGSISKTFTAALVLTLRDDGLLALDAPISSYLPGLDLPGVTARNLLAHHSGLRREPSPAFTAEYAHGDPERVWWERAAGGDVAALLTGLDPSALVHHPFRVHHYSNLGYGLLGAVIEKVAGQPWRDCLRQRILDPLGLSRTTYDPVAPYAVGYVASPLDDSLREEPRHDAGAMAPAGQLWSTLDDLASWTAFLATPDPAVLVPSTMDEMCVPASMVDPGSWSSGYGLGIQMWRSGDRVYAGHTGSMPGYLAVLMTHRPSATAVVAFANAYTMVGGSLQGLALRVLDAVLDGQPAAPVDPPVAAASVPADVAALLGSWWWMGRRHDISWDGQLVVTYVAEPASPWRFTHSNGDTWRCHSGMNDGETMIVRRARDGAPISLDVATFCFTRQPWPQLDA